MIAMPKPKHINKSKKLEFQSPVSNSSSSSEHCNCNMCRNALTLELQQSSLGNRKEEKNYLKIINKK